MGLFSFVGDIVQDVFGGSKSRSESAQYNSQAMAQQQAYAQQNMETQQSYNLQSMQQQQQYNLQSMAQQNQYNIEAFNRENEYNSPLQQRLRAQAAGINQNWQDGAGVVAQQDSGVSSGVPSGGMPSASPGGVPGVSSALADPSSLLEGVMHLSRFNKENKLLDQQIATEQAKQKQLLGAARRSNTEADDLEMSREDRFEQIKQNIYNTDADTRKKLAEAGLTEEKMATWFDEAFAAIDKDASISEYNRAMRDRCYQMVDYECANLDADTRKNLAEEAYYNVLPNLEQQKINVENRKARAQEVHNAVEQYKAETERSRVQTENKLTEAIKKHEGWKTYGTILKAGADAYEYKLKKFAYDKGLSQEQMALVNQQVQHHIYWLDENINRMIEQNVNDDRRVNIELERLRLEQDKFFYEMTSDIVNGTLGRNPQRAGRSGSRTSNWRKTDEGWTKTESYSDYDVYH